MKQIQVTWCQDNAAAHTSAQVLAAVENAGFELLRHPPYLPFVLHGKWLAGRPRTILLQHHQIWRNTGPSAFYLQETMLKSDKIWCAYLVVNCFRLQTFLTLLICLRYSWVLVWVFLNHSESSWVESGYLYVAPPTHEPYLPLLLSRKASPPFGWYSLHLPMKGWLGWVDVRNAVTAMLWLEFELTDSGTLGR